MLEQTPSEASTAATGGLRRTGRAPRCLQDVRGCVEQVLRLATEVRPVKVVQ